MIKTGEKLICWDSTKQDMYTVTAAQDTDNEMEVNPLVKICGVILYPMQHAAMFPDTASECAPLPEGTVCRLKLICKGWLCFALDYAASLKTARDLMMESTLTRLNRSGNRLDNVINAGARGEFEILIAHGKGKYQPRSVMGLDAPFLVCWPDPCIERDSGGLLPAT